MGCGGVVGRTLFNIGPAFPIWSSNLGLGDLLFCSPSFLLVCCWMILLFLDCNLVQRQTDDTIVIDGAGVILESVDISTLPISFILSFFIGTLVDRGHHVSF